MLWVANAKQLQVTKGTYKMIFAPHNDAYADMTFTTVTIEGCEEVNFGTAYLPGQ